MFRIHFFLFFPYHFLFFSFLFPFPQERAKKLVGEMTTEEKLELFHGSCGGYTGNV